MAVVQPVVPYDLFQVTAPINRQNRDEHSPCHTPARDNASHAAVVQPATIAIQGTLVNRDSGGPVGAGVSEDNVMYTLTKSDTHAVAQSLVVRRLTPEECEILQGFQRDHTRIPWKGKSLADCPDGPRYRALGNSMAVPVIAWIGRKIDTALKR